MGSSSGDGESALSMDDMGVEGPEQLRSLSNMSGVSGPRAESTLLVERAGGCTTRPATAATGRPSSDVRMELRTGASAWRSRLGRSLGERRGVAPTGGMTTVTSPPAIWGNIGGALEVVTNVKGCTPMELPPCTWDGRVGPGVWAVLRTRMMGMGLVVTLTLFCTHVFLDVLLTVLLREVDMASRCALSLTNKSRGTSP